jgi:L-asparagine transporter-like permease
MTTGNSSTPKSANIQKSERYCIAALIFLTLAIVFLSVVVFTLSPLSIWGILATCLGVILMICCIVCFALYSHYLKKEEESVAG